MIKAQNLEKLTFKSILHAVGTATERVPKVFWEELRLLLLALKLTCIDSTDTKAATARPQSRFGWVQVHHRQSEAETSMPCGKTARLLARGPQRQPSRCKIRGPLGIWEFMKPTGNALAFPSHPGLDPLRPAGSPRSLMVGFYPIYKFQPPFQASEAFQPVVQGRVQSGGVAEDGMTT